MILRAANAGLSLRGPQTPSYGYPARLRSSTQRLPRRATRDGRRGPCAAGRHPRHRCPEAVA